MKNKIIIPLFFFAAAFTACEKTEVAPELSVAINPAQVVSTINDTLVVYKGEAVEFQLSGTPDLLTFFSGEGGHVYANRERTIANGTPKLDFLYNSNRVSASNVVDVFASTDFKGVYDSLNIKAAKWDTLTHPDMKAYLNTAVAKAMPTIDLSKYGGGQAVFIAYRLVINSTIRYSNPTFSNLLIRNYQDDGNVSAVVDGFSSAGMSFVTMSENAKWKLKGSGSSTFKLSSNSITVNTTPFDVANGTVDSVFTTTDGRLHEMWAISKVLYLDKTSPDVGVNVKDIQQGIENYKYTYTKVGNYTVTFVGANTGPTGVLNSTIKELIVKVIDKPAI